MELPSFTDHLVNQFLADDIALLGVRFNDSNWFSPIFFDEIGETLEPDKGGFCSRSNLVPVNFRFFLD